MKDLRFFTDKSVKNDYLLIQYKQYIKMKDFSKWKEVFIDPSVYELKNNPFYSFESTLNIKKFLDSLPINHYFSVDYPSDMNMDYQELFLNKSWNNAFDYCNHSQYIPTVQSRFKDFWNFTEWFNKYNNLNIKSNILGIGNVCQIKYLTEYLENIIDYAISNSNHKRIHFYGLCLKAIPLAVKLSKRYDIILSTDSLKWTKACTVELKNKHQTINCNKSNRQEFFNEYLKLIKKKISINS